MAKFFRKLRPTVIQLYHCNKYNTAISRVLPQCSAANFTSQTQQFRCCSNLVKSPFPDWPIPSQLLSEYIWSKNEKWGDLTAVVCGVSGRKIDYQSLRKMCKRLATSLLQNGHKPGQVVAVMLPNILEFPAVSLGIIEAGLVASTINPLYTEDEICYQVKMLSAVAVITIPSKVETVFKVKEKLKAEGSGDFKIICTPDVTGSEGEIPSGIDRFSDYVSDSVDESVLPSLQSDSQNQEDVVFIPFSSGTTGRPKGVCLTHRNLIANFAYVPVTKDLEEASNDYQEVIPFIIPGFHLYGFGCIMMQSIYHGGKLIMIPKFEENSFIRILKDYKPTVLYLVPPLIIFIGSSPKMTKELFESVKLIVSSAAPCAKTDVLKCMKKTPDTVSYKQVYGMSETIVICMPPGKFDKFDSCGAPSLNTLMKVKDTQTGKALGPYEEGEICVKGPKVMKGYYNNEKANSESFDSEGWFHTGDVGYYDNENHFYITDRIKELIKVKGFQVSPAELEGVLRSHPSIADAAVIGVPDARKGEKPVGFVKLMEGAALSADDIKEFMSSKVTKYKVIDDINFVEAIPKNASGKILRKEIKSNYLKSTLAQAER